MNRRDAALIAHLDAIEGRLTTHLDAIEERVTHHLLLIEERLDRIAEDIAGIKLELATHHHEGS